MSLTLCEGNPPVTSRFPSQRPVTQGFGVFFDVHLNKRFNKHLRRWWFEMPLHPLWCQCNAIAWASVEEILWCNMVWSVANECFKCKILYNIGVKWVLKVSNRFKSILLVQTYLISHWTWNIWHKSAIDHLNNLKSIFVIQNALCSRAEVYFNYLPHGLIANTI